MPHKKSQTKRGVKNKNSKSRKGLSTNFYSMLNINNKYMNSSILQLSIICILSVVILIQLHTILSSSLINYNNINTIINIETDITHNSNNNNNVKTSDGHQFCRIQSTDNQGYIAFEGCRVIPNAQSDKPNDNIQTNNYFMSNEEKDINEIMTQLHSNTHTTFGANVDHIFINSVKVKDKRKKKNKKKKKVKTKKTTIVKEEEKEDIINNENAWQPRRERGEQFDFVDNKNKNNKIIKDKMNQHIENEFDINDTEIDINLMGMYRRGYKFELQLNKMHYKSDSVYEQIMEDISTNGISQADIYKKYHINFIPDETQFKLIPPTYNNTYYIKYYNTIHYNKMGAGVINNYNKAIKSEAFTNFYALTRMQQKYKRNDIEIEYDYDIEDDIIEAVNNDNNNNIEYDMNMLRDMLGYPPYDILNIILNDNKLPQWLYESDTILDINCGIGDSLIYLLNNFTTIKGICVVGTSSIKYKYAYLNIQQNGLLNRIDIINKDLYSSFVKSLYNISDIIYIDFSHIGDDEYLKYFVNNIMNDHSIRQTKPGRVMLSYDRLLFDTNIFQASYTLHFASGWNKLINDVSFYMYSMPFFVSKLSNLYVQNYKVFYGYDMHPIFNKLDLGLSNKVLKTISSSSSDSIFENDKVNKIWKTLSSQLLYKSFMNCIQKLINKAADKHEIHMEVNQRLLDILALVNSNKKNIPANNEWQFIQFLIQNGERVKDKQCLVYKHVFKEWKSQVEFLLKENDEVGFHHLIKDSAQLKMQSLLDKCNNN